jgi:hypothetical protein
VRDSVHAAEHTCIVKIQHHGARGSERARGDRGGSVAKKRYDPLWKIVGEEVALQGGEPDVDARCPYCHVTVHVGLKARAGERYECGLCGGVSLLAEEEGGLTLKPAGR